MRQNLQSKGRPVKFGNINSTMTIKSYMKVKNREFLLQTFEAIPNLSAKTELRAFTFSATTTAGQITTTTNIPVVQYKFNLHTFKHCNNRNGGRKLCIPRHIIIKSSFPKHVRCTWCAAIQVNRMYLNAALTAKIKLQTDVLSSKGM